MQEEWQMFSKNRELHSSLSFLNFIPSPQFHASILQYQPILQSYSNQHSMVLAQRHTDNGTGQKTQK